MKRTIALLAALVSAVVLAQPPASEVAITAEPSHHLALENAQVRVFQVEVAPHAETLMHRHGHDYFFVTLGAAEIENDVEGKPPVRLQLRDGETRFTPGGFAHLAKNLAEIPFRNVTIELLQGETGASQPAPPAAEELKPRELTGGTATLLLVKDGVRVAETRLQAGGTIPKHHHAGPHLVVAVTDLALRSDAEGAGASTRELKAGEIAWIPGDITHTVTNVAPTEIRLITFEFPSETAK